MTATATETKVKAENLAVEDLLNTRRIAQAARDYQRQQGKEVGTRGRLSVEQFTEYLMRSPKTARAIAAALGVEVDGKGFVKKDVAVQLASAIR